MTSNLIYGAFGSRQMLSDDGLTPLSARVMGPREIYGILRRRKFMIVSIVVIGTIACLAAAMLLPRLYTATSTILIEKDDPNLLEEQLQETSPEPVNTHMDTVSDRIKSRGFAGIVVDDQKLMEDPDFNTYLEPRDTSLTDEIKDLLVRRDEKPKAQVTTEVQRDQAISVLLSTMSVSRNGDSAAMSVSVEADTPAKAARLANAVASLYVKWSRDLKVESTRQATDFLREQSNSLAKTIAEREKEIALFGSNNDVWADPNDNLLRLSMQQTNEQLTQARADVAKAQSRLLQVKQFADGRLPVEDMTLISSFLTTLRGQQAEALNRKSQIARNFGSNHPEILAVDAELATIGRSITDEMSRIVDGLRGEVAIAQSSVDKIEAQLEAAYADLRIRAPSEIRLRELNRDLLTEQKLYDVVFARLGKMDPYAEIAGPGARVISVAATPTSPSFPKVKMMAVGGIAGSLVIAILAAMTMESLNGAMTDPRRIAQTLRAPVLSFARNGGLFRRRRATTIMRAILANEDVCIAARFRALWDVCSRRIGTTPPVSIMVASLDKAAARSNIAVGLARAAVASGAHTLLLDLDTKNITVARSLRFTGSDAAIENLFSGDCSASDLIHPVLSVPGLAYAFSEKDRSRQRPFMSGREFDLLLDLFRSEFDVIIIDAPPFMDAQDILPSANSVDSVLLALKYGVTLESAVVEFGQRVRLHEAPLIGVVVVDSDSDQSVFMDGTMVMQRRRVSA